MWNIFVCALIHILSMGHFICIVIFIYFLFFRKRWILLKCLHIEMIYLCTKLYLDKNVLKAHLLWDELLFIHAVILCKKKCIHMIFLVDTLMN